MAHEIKKRNDPPGKTRKKKRKNDPTDRSAAKKRPFWYGEGAARYQRNTHKSKERELSSKRNPYYSFKTPENPTRAKTECKYNKTNNNKDQQTPSAAPILTQANKTTHETHDKNEINPHNA